MKTCVLALTTEGNLLARRIAEVLHDCQLIESDRKVAEILHDVWGRYQGVICVMAAGIVVRSIAPLLLDKTTDPCVVVVDQRGDYAISLVSGHLGGGNLLARNVAESIGGVPVITTASDVSGRTALDLWARRNNLIVTDRHLLTEKSAKIVNGELLAIHSSFPLPHLPAELVACAVPGKADICISYNKDMTFPGLCCIPEILYVGIGCNRGTATADIEHAFVELCEMHRLDERAVAGIATIDVKNDEAGILQFGENHGFPISYYTRQELNGVEDVSYSAAAMKAVGAQGVAEPAALLAAQAECLAGELIIRKMKWQDVTMAVALRIKNRWD